MSSRNFSDEVTRKSQLLKFFKKLHIVINISYLNNTQLDSNNLLKILKTHKQRFIHYIILALESQHVVVLIYQVMSHQYLSIILYIH